MTDAATPRAAPREGGRQRRRALQPRPGAPPQRT
jgi:hypothetical protein